MSMKIVQAATETELETARVLFREYAAALNVDLCFQGFTAELAGLPGPYSPPRGRLLIAWSGSEAAGCVALRPMGKAGVCELKRLFVREGFRGKGLGRKMTEAIIAEAKGIGFVSMRLDTLPSLQAATKLYESLGFVRRSAYYDTPLSETIFMELRW
jgi:putative acetyltransferase